MNEHFAKGDIIYFSHILPELDVYDLCELYVRCVQHDYISAMDKRDKRVYLFYPKDIDVKIYKNRNDALNSIKLSERNRKAKKFTIENKED